MSVPNPLVRDRDIRAAVKDKGHWLNPDAQRRTACISDIGNDLAVHFTSLGPNKESTEIHHHYNNSEWLYILKGTGLLLLCDADVKDGTAPGMIPTTSVPQITEHEVGPGDFMGFKGMTVTPGQPAHAHSLRAGPEGMEYLVGGTRKELDVCVYPMKGKSLLIHQDGPRAVLEHDHIASQTLD